MTDPLLGPDPDEVCGLNVLPPVVVLVGSMVYAALLGYFATKAVLDTYSYVIERRKS